MNRVFVVGDNHTQLYPFYNLVENLDRGDFIISVGDFGAGGIPLWKLNDLGKEAKAKDIQILATRGNHDSPIFWKENRKYGNLEFVPDYSVRDILGKRYLFIGGAVSIDRIDRTQGIDWWEDEKVIYDLSLLDGIKDVDVLITHTCPDFSTPAPKNFANIKWALDADKTLKADLIFEREYMTQVWNKLKVNNNIQQYYYGHFHVSLTEFIDGARFQCLNINEIYMVP